MNRYQPSPCRAGVAVVAAVLVAGVFATASPGEASGVGLASPVSHQVVLASNQAPRPACT